VIYAVAMLRDAAAIVPEIGELAAPVLLEDAALIDAEIEIKWARDLLAEPDNPWIIELSGADHVAKKRRDLEAQLAAAIDRVANTEAKTARGRAIKARFGDRSMTGYPEVPEAVALKLMERIERAERQEDRRTRNRSTRADLLDLYAECLAVVCGQKRSADYHNLLH
jgi:hypothetical protein